MNESFTLRQKRPCKQVEKHKLYIDREDMRAEQLKT